MKGVAVRFIHKYAMNLRVNATAGSTMTGKMISIAATDCEFFEMIIMPLFIPICPMVFIMASVLIYLIIGPVGLVAIGIMLIYLVLLYKIGD